MKCLHCGQTSNVAQELLRTKQARDGALERIQRLRRGNARHKIVQALTLKLRPEAWAEFPRRKGLSRADLVVMERDRAIVREYKSSNLLDMLGRGTLNRNVDAHARHAARHESTFTRYFDQVEVQVAYDRRSTELAEIRHAQEHGRQVMYVGNEDSIDRHMWGQPFDQTTWSAIVTRDQAEGRPGSEYLDLRAWSQARLST